MERESLKATACAEVDRWADRLVGVSRQIHDHPELAYEELLAHDVLVQALDDAGMAPEPSVYGVRTAFRAAAGGEGPAVAVLCEYDALPGIGHACGHNVIAAAGLGAGLALAGLAREGAGRVVVMGTPAEEGGGGKITLARRGAFAGVDAAMMIHPADADLLRMDCIAIQQAQVDYAGKAAHAAAAPHEGRNALDAAVLGYMNVAALRQHIEPTDRVHGIFRDGGQAPNIVPEHASMEWLVRSANLATLEPLRRRVEACWEAGAAASGCTCRHRVLARPYADMVDNGVIAGLYARNADALGRPVKAAGTDGQRVVGSTDMGNVSYVAPSIHPLIRVSPPGVSIHTHDFAAHAVGPMGDEAVIVGAKALAMTIADLWADRELVTSARDAWEAQLASRGQGERP
jgi:amidohydrolase